MATPRKAQAATAPIPAPPPPAPALPSYAFPTKPDSKASVVWSIRGAFMALFYAIPLTFALGFPLRFLLFATPTTPKGTPNAATVAWEVFGPVLLIYGVLAVVIAVLVVVYANLAVRRFTFEVGEDEVIVRKGVLFRTTTRIPLRRIQDIHVRQGPLLRAFGLASLKLDTAGGFTPVRNGRGLTAEGEMPAIRDAEDVAHHLMQRIKHLKGDV